MAYPVVDVIEKRRRVSETMAGYIPMPPCTIIIPTDPKTRIARPASNERFDVSPRLKNTTYAIKRYRTQIKIV